MNKCEICRCNKICDHNLFGFEICDNFISEDVVEVVRCKDCKNYKPQIKSAQWNNKKRYCCRSAAVKVNDDDFCSFGERKVD